MKSYFTFIVFSLLGFLFINGQTEDNSTVYNLTQNITDENITLDTTTSMPIILEQTTEPYKQTITYVEPPLHPLGYCVRSRLPCSKIRRCCNGPCNINIMRCT